jgi:FtsH-binding integral membrane protein
MAYHSRYIVGGNNAHHVMNEKDYVFGAMTLYNDVINIFIYLLKAIGEDKEKH